MKVNNESLDLATQVLQEQLNLLSDTPENIEVDLSKTKTILDITKQMVDIEKVKSGQDKLDLEKQKFIYDMCKDMAEGSIRYIPKAYSEQVKMIE